MKTIVRLLGVALTTITVAGLPSVASAVAVQAAQTGVITHFPCPSFCGGAGARFNSAFDGGVGFSTSFSSLSNGDGNGRASASLNGPTELPVLRAEGFSGPNSRGVGEAVGMQGFFYNGGGSGSYMLDVFLTGVALDTDPSPFTTDGSLTAKVLIFRDNNPATDTPYSTAYDTLKFEILPFAGDLEELADAGTTLQIIADGQVRSISTTLSVSGLNAGDLIYVWANLIGEGTRNGFGDGFNTLTMEFQDPTGLSPHAPVPVPPAIALFGSALMLGWWRRRAR